MCLCSAPSAGYPTIIWGSNTSSASGNVGASIQQAGTASLDSVRTALDADPTHDRLVLLRATSQELGPTRDAVVDAAVQRLELSQKQAAEAYTLAETFETNPVRSGATCKGSHV